MPNQNKYYFIEIDLSNAETTIVDDWDFTFWPNKPKHEIVKNPDGTFSVLIEENYVPLFNQLNAFFKNEQSLLENETYIGDPIIKGRLKPCDIISYGFIQYEKGILISLNFFTILKTFNIPPFRYYPVLLKKGRKEIKDYFYIAFLDSDSEILDLKFIKKEWTLVPVVSESLKNKMEEKKLTGIIFNEVK